jgi:hypothetical protein
MEWVVDFINKYSKYLPEASREDEVNLSYSKVGFDSGDFKGSLSYINHIKPTNFLHYFDTSLLRLCNYYELDMIEEAYSEIDKFRHYIRSHNEIPKIHKLNNSNFIKIYLLLLKAKSDPAYNESGVLKNELKSFANVSKRPWLNKKIAELENRKLKSKAKSF